jgi:predicted metalloprotease with PDZ domain
MSRHPLASAAVALLLCASPAPGRAAPPPPPDSSVSAPIRNVRYELTFDSAAAARRSVRVAMSFEVAGPQPVLLSLPVWAPGHYEIMNFARRLSRFGVTQDGQPRHWDKWDYDTWRVRPGGPGTVTVTFQLAADTLQNASAWARPDFLMANGTSLFLFPRGRSLDFAATVTVHTEPRWLVTTGMHPAGTALTYREGNYHDLTDMPFFIGRYDLDSVQIAGKWTRLATYPAGRFSGEPRERLWRDLAGTVPAESRVFDATPWDDYTVFMIFDDQFPGGSALEHQSSNVGIYTPEIIGTPILTNVVAHEMFHAWNVKRLRPAAMVPYRYDAAQATTLLWVSEGFSDYYADLAQVRGGGIDSAAFLRMTYGHVQTVSNAPPASVEDASLSVWIHPTDGTDYLYYDKGSVLGLLLDVLIRDASDDHRSLDDVMRALYRSTYRAGRGFTNDEFWAEVSRQAGGRSFTEFYRLYVDGPDALPLDSILSLAGMHYSSRTFRAPRLGLSSSGGSWGTRITSVTPGGAYEAAGGQVGDTLLILGGVDVRQDYNFDEFRRRWTDSDQPTLPIVVHRAGQELTLHAPVRLVDWHVTELTYDSSASPKAARIRSGILRGITER